MNERIILIIRGIAAELRAAWPEWRADAAAALDGLADSLAGAPIDALAEALRLARLVERGPYTEETGS